MGLCVLRENVDYHEELERVSEEYRQSYEYFSADCRPGTEKKACIQRVPELIYRPEKSKQKIIRDTQRRHI